MKFVYNFKMVLYDNSELMQDRFVICRYMYKYTVLYDIYICSRGMFFFNRFVNLYIFSLL